ncbi:MAG: proprotein convertase P-domain-containing protein [Phycisphaerales bacterium]|jgi:subtilisin-like proprotein convertase family protein|nr:proprotein convertase P-domain-containing protein [Phycisphaerales bacterium]
MFMRATVAATLLAGFTSTGSASPIEIVPTVELPSLDFHAVEVEDVDREAAGLAPRYAIPHESAFSPSGSGIWEVLPDGRLNWRLRITSPLASSINLGFERWELPNSAEMTVSTADGRTSLRAFTSMDNRDHGELWTPPLPGDDILISIAVAPKERSLVESQVVLTSINVGYRGFYDMVDAARSGSCNYDVTCPETVGWEDEIPCVAAISTGGSLFCSGFMVNNIRNDRDPLFMTADHCGVSAGNAASLVTFWNYENDPAVNCPGAGGETATLDQFLTGSDFLASGSASDYTIVRLNSSPQDDWEISYCGWDAGPQASEWSVAIHHPNVDAKRWSIDYDPSEVYGYGSPGDDHIRIIDWDLGTTEPGSSGSPLFDQNHRVIGQLHGGYAACGNDSEDWYGRLYTSWNAGLSSVLDPDGTGQTFCDTLPGRGMAVQPGEGTTHVCVGGCASPDPASVLYTISNASPEAITWSAGIKGAGFLSIDGPSSGNIAPGGTADLLVVVNGEGWANGTYQSVLSIFDETNDIEVNRTHTLEIGLTGFGTTPEHDFVAGGPLGGPFETTQAYTLTSTHPTETTVRVSADQPWISLNGSAGPLDIALNGVGDSAVVEVGFSSAADDLPAGLVYGIVTFDNLDDVGEGDTTRDVTLDVGRFTYTAYDTPIPITDNAEITSTIQVGDAYCIGDLDVELDITHTYIGDLIVDLEAPSGVIVRLHDRSGGSTDNLNVVYDDDGGALPDGPGELADFVGEIVTGTWTLRVSDNAGADQGSLDAWTLKIASTGDACPPSANDVATATDVDTPVDIQLEGASAEGNPLSFEITSLPSDGDLSDPGAGQINSVPYTLASYGDVVTYSPDSGFLGGDLFTYRTFDGVYSDEAVVTVEVGAIPNPDDCHQAFDLPNGQWDFSTLEATTDGAAHDQCDFDGQTYHDIWFRYTACGDGGLTVSTCDAADYDTDLVLYETSCQGSMLACNDDASGCSGYTSEVSVNVTEGEVVIIRVGGWNEGDQGTGTLTIAGPEGDCGGEPCDGDLNADGVVDVDDILEAVAGYGTDYDVDDILLVLENYGSNC